MVRIGLKCSVDQLMTTGLFHAGTFEWSVNSVGL
jgi:hypothetical protein